MKQGNRFLRHLSMLLTAVCFLWLGVALLRRTSEPVQTCTAKEIRFDETVSVMGFVVRDELLLSSTCPVVFALLSEGAKAGAGQAIALGSPDGEIDTVCSRLSSLHRNIRLLETAMNAAPSAVQDTTRRLLCAQAGALRITVSESDRLKALILRDQITTGQLQEKLEELQSQYTSITEALPGTVLCSPMAGWFSACVDGFETVLTPELVQTADAETLFASAPEHLSSGVYGRLIRSGTWYYVTRLPYGEQQTPEIGDVVTLSFPGGYPESAEMRVTRIELQPSGMYLLVLSCSQFPDGITTLRQQSGNLRFHTCHGLKIPRSAIHVDDKGHTGVYILEGVFARWTPVTLLHTDAAFCIAEQDLTDTAHLRAGDTILLEHNLYDGKVVYP